MGLYRIQLKREAVDSIPVLMTSLGFPVTRVEERDNGTYYFYKDPKKKKEFAFWTATHDSELFWYSGLSPSAKKIAEGFSMAGLFADEKAA